MALAVLELSSELRVEYSLNTGLLIVLMECIVEVVFFESRCDVCVELGVDGRLALCFD